MDVCRVNRDTGAVVCDSTFTAVQEPGPPLFVLTTGRVPGVLTAGDTVDLRPLIQYGEDVYRNRIDAEVIRAHPDSVVSWAWKSGHHETEDVLGTGWLVPSPDAVSLGYWRLSPSVDGDCWHLYAYLRLTIDGTTAGDLLAYFDTPEGADPPGPEPLCRDL